MMKRFWKTTWIAAALLVAATAGAFSATSDAATLSVDFDVNATVNVEPGFSRFDWPVGIVATNVTRTYGSMTVTVIDNSAGLGNDSRLRAIPVDSGAFTDDQLLQDFIFPRGTVADQGLDVYVTGLVPFGVYSGSIWSVDTSSGGSRVSDWQVNGAMAINNYTFTSPVPAPTTNTQLRIDFGDVIASADGTVTIKGRSDPTSVTTNLTTYSNGVFLNAFELDQTGVLQVDPTPALQVDFGKIGVNGATAAGFEQMDLAANGVTLSSGKTVTLSGVGVSLDERDRAVPVNSPLFTESDVMREFIFAGNGAADTTGMDILVEGLAPNQEYLATIWAYDSTSTGQRASTWTTSIDSVDYQFAPNTGPTTNDSDKFRIRGVTNASGELLIEGRKASFGRDTTVIFVNGLQLNAVVPEPSSAMLLCVGSLGLAAFRRRRR